MSPYDFQKLLEANDPDDAIQVIFEETHTIWTFEGNESLTSAQRVVIAVATYFGEVLNGGFYQYLSNESGGFANFAPTALRSVGLSNYAAALEPFLRLFPNGHVPEDSEIRQQQLDVIADQYDDEFFEGLEKPFWDLYRQADREYIDKLFNFVVANEDEFISVDT